MRRLIVSLVGCALLLLFVALHFSPSSIVTSAKSDPKESKTQGSSVSRRGGGKHQTWIPRASSVLRIILAVMPELAFQALRVARVS